MTLDEAIAIMKSDSPPKMSPAEFKQIREAEKVIVRAGLCPSCACDGAKNKLGEWQEGDVYNNAGRECLQCEDFHVCGPQPEYELADGPSDADSGL
jgi:hypothetical protein